VALRTAVILAGGLGTRLRTVVFDRPKVLAPVNGRPFLTYLLDQLTEVGVRRVVLCTGHLGDQVSATFGTAYGPLALLYSREPVQLGTGGAVRLALPFLDCEPMLVLNGDTICGVDFAEFLRSHVTCRASGSLAVTFAKDSSRYGRVQLCNSGEIMRFEEKFQLQPGRTHSPQAMRSETTDHVERRAECPAGWINAGVYLLSRHLVSTIPEGRPVSIEREVLPAWVGRGLYGYPVGGPFLDIGTPESYALAATVLAGRSDLALEADHS
jgi:D-glycero-alpha-D-manno-heptose 1-phosphate guanylyltransferase